MEYEGNGRRMSWRAHHKVWTQYCLRLTGL
jgi:hypothetical protein